MRLRSFRFEITVCRKSTGIKQKYSASNPRDAITVLGYSNKKIHALSVFIQFWANNLNVKDKLPQNGKKRVIVNSILQWSLWPRWGTKESGHCRGSFSFDWKDTSHSRRQCWFSYMACYSSGRDEPNPALWAGHHLVHSGLSAVSRKPYNNFASLRISTPSHDINTPKKRTWPISSYLDQTINVTVIPSSIFWFACQCHS